MSLRSIDAKYPFSKKNARAARIAGRDNDVRSSLLATTTSSKVPTMRMQSFLAEEEERGTERMRVKAATRVAHRRSDSSFTKAWRQCDCDCDAPGSHPVA